MLEARSSPGVEPARNPVSETRPVGPQTTAAARLPRRRLLAAGAGVSLLYARGTRRASAWPIWDDGEVAHAVTAPMRGRALPAAALARQEPEAPAFSDVAGVEPWDALLFLAGRDPRHPDGSVDSIMGFSPADILETMDTVVLDTVEANRGGGALGTLYRTIAAQVLDALLATYGGAPVLLALDAGHGGKPGSTSTSAPTAPRPGIPAAPSRRLRPPPPIRAMRR
jgi:hypothetical protein